MRIVTRAELMAMAAGTVFSYAIPRVMTGLHVKGETTGPDFTEVSLIGSVGCGDDAYSSAWDKLEAGAEVPLDLDCYGREGFFDDTQQFAVYSRADVIDLVAVLLDAIR